MTQATQKKLQGMLNRSYRYGGKTVTVTGYEENEKGRVYIHSNEKENHWDRPADDVMSLLKQFEPEAAAQGQDNADAGSVMLRGSNGTINTLNTILLDNIAELKKNPAYINQAKAINNTVANMINLQKTQIEFFKATKGR